MGLPAGFGFPNAAVRISIGTSWSWRAINFAGGAAPAALLLPGSDYLSVYGVQRLLLRQLVIGGAQHHATAFFRLDDGTQAPIEHVLAECRFDHRGDLAEGA